MSVSGKPGTTLHGHLDAGRKQRICQKLVLARDFIHTQISLNLLKYAVFSKSTSIYYSHIYITYFKHIFLPYKMLKGTLKLKIHNIFIV